ncbi:putative 3-hydroxyacyl-CoA dehydrogenase, partial [Zancudomyces culisetae]
SKYSTVSGSDVARTKVPFKNITIFGSGMMGSGIAQVSAASEYHVNLVDLNKGALDRSQKYILSSLKRIARKKTTDERMQTKYIDEVLSRINFTTESEHAVASSDMVIEAVVENIEIKQNLFKSLDPVASPQTLFVSNTSSLKIKDIFRDVSEKRKERIGGLHFFNPVPQMKLLEVIKTDTTKQEVFDTLFNYGVSVGKVCVVCKDMPGFIVNRLLVPYMLEAVKMLERGDASAKDIDIAMKYGAGYPMGPFELLDYVGLDTTYFVAKGWYEDSEIQKMELVKPPSVLKKLVEAGNLGIKSGKGFYEHRK